MRGCCVVAGILHHCTPSAGHLPFDQARTSGGKLCKDASSGPWPSLPPSELWSVHHTPRPKTTPTKTSPAMQLVASTQGKHRPDEWSTSGQQCGRRRSSTRGQRKSTLPIVGAHGGASFHQQLRVSSGQRPRATATVVDLTSASCLTTALRRMVVASKNGTSSQEGNVWHAACQTADGICRSCRS